MAALTRTVPRMAIRMATRMEETTKMVKTKTATEITATETTTAPMEMGMVTETVIKIEIGRETTTTNAIQLLAPPAYNHTTTTILSHPKP